VIKLAILALGRGPCLPAVGLVEDVAVFLPVEGGFGGFVGFEAVEVFEEEQPGRLLGVIEFSGATGFLAEHVVDVSEGLLKHGGCKLLGNRSVVPWGQHSSFGKNGKYDYYSWVRAVPAAVRSVTSNQ